ncbi:hypothetical protein QYF36_017051 [Acer negundo]|nr:hypothetical protein QYF36_017051 [Acer negundo]
MAASTFQFLLRLQIHLDRHQPPSRVTEIVVDEQVFEINEQGFARRNRVKVLLHLFSRLLHSCLFCCRRSKVSRPFSFSTNYYEFRSLMRRI